jgi:hypothetical protein
MLHMIRAVKKENRNDKNDRRRINTEHS